MTEFKSWRSYSEFERAAKLQTRYIHDHEVKDFLQTVRYGSEKRVEVIPAGQFLWRAQLGHDWRSDDEYIGDVPAPCSPERMKPPTERATEGRANPKGISYLYLATDRDTALAEVRPWIGALISVSQFKTLRELRIVNCTTDHEGFRIYLEGEPSPQEREEVVWTDIDRAFARPVSPSDDVADYVATQIVAELFKTCGFDGVAYRSSLGGGHNIVLFDLDAAEPINGFLFQAKKVKFDFEEAANPYFLRRHYEKVKSEGA